MKKTKVLAAMLCVAMLLTGVAATATPARAATCPCAVEYALGTDGVTADMTGEKVAVGKKVTTVPKVEGIGGAVFLGWTSKDPATLTPGEEIKLMDPKATPISTDTVFYAVYDTTGVGADHEHYMKGYPNGDFGPGDNITRAEVAAIIARGCLPGYLEASDYGTGGYSDLDGTHWATSAIAFTTREGVFQGYDDGNFYPDKPITRQEFAVVFARMIGEKDATGMELPFSDIADAGDWAVNGIYTAYDLGWVNGYTDGTFKPLSNIARSEAAKMVNRYLNRGVDADGISPCYDQVKQWPDVPETYWAYYEILEATNGHTFRYVDGKTPPETWSKAFIRTADWGI